MLLVHRSQSIVRSGLFLCCLSLKTVNSPQLILFLELVQTLRPPLLHRSRTSSLLSVLADAGEIRPASRLDFLAAPNEGLSRPAVVVNCELAIDCGQLVLEPFPRPA